jgi:hypothetical protein
VLHLSVQIDWTLAVPLARSRRREPSRWPVDLTAAGRLCPRRLSARLHHGILRQYQPPRRRLVPARGLAANPSSLC